MCLPLYSAFKFSEILCDEIKQTIIKIKSKAKGYGDLSARNFSPIKESGITLFTDIYKIDI